MNIYIKHFITYVLLISTLDFYTNKFYKRIWNKKSNHEKLLIIFYLVFHNIIYFINYFTIFYLVYFFKDISLIYFVLYFLMPISLIIHWKTNNNKCWITVKQNRLLEISDDYGFRDIFAVLGNFHTKTGNSKKITLRDKLYKYYNIFCFCMTGLLIFRKLM